MSTENTNIVPSNNNNLKPVWFGQKIIQEKTTVADAFNKCGLSWRVEKEPLYMEGGNGNFIAVRDNFLTVRNDLVKSDARRVLGVVKGRYEPIQNVESFSVVDSIVEESDAVVETAGVLKNGRIVYMLINLPGKVMMKEDILEKYILITNRHDGKGCMKALYTNVRVVCMNTLMLAIKSAEHGLNIRHARNKNEQIAIARKLLKDSSAYYGAMVDVYKQLAEHKVNTAFVNGYIEALVPNKKDNEESTKIGNIRNRIRDLFYKDQAGFDMDGVAGTAYGLLNATTQYIDHERTTRARGETSKVESRIDSTFFGSGSIMRQTAFSLLCREAGIDNAGRLTPSEEALTIN